LFTATASLAIALLDRWTQKSGRRVIVCPVLLCPAASAFRTPLLLISRIRTPHLLLHTSTALHLGHLPLHLWLRPLILRLWPLGLLALKLRLWPLKLWLRSRKLRLLPLELWLRTLCLLTLKLRLLALRLWRGPLPSRVWRRSAMVAAAITPAPAITLAATSPLALGKSRARSRNKYQRYYQNRS
jgi:hypothetical protein